MSSLKCTKHANSNHASNIMLKDSAFVPMLQSFWPLSAAAVCLIADSRLPVLLILWFTVYHVYACNQVHMKLLSLVLPGSCSLSAYWAIWQLVTAFYCLCCLSTYCIWVDILVLIKHVLISAFLETAAAFRIQQSRKSLFLVLSGHPPFDVCETHVVSFMVVLVNTVLWAHRIVDRPLQPQCKPV